MIERSNGAPHVLIIDDEAGILDSLRILLKNEGFTPHVALGGKQGLEQIESLSPDIILSDVRMPTVSGLEVLSAARQRDPDTPVILMTAQATLQSAMQAVNEGAFYYLQKPFRNDDLVAILRRAAEHRSLRVENHSLKQEIKRRDLTQAGRPVGKSKSWLEVLRLPPEDRPGDVGEAEVAEALGYRTIREAYADRAYQFGGLLVPRQMPGAVLHDPAAIAERSVRLATSGEIVAADGAVFSTTARSLCIHGDTPDAVAIARAVKDALASAGVEIRAAL